MMMMMRIITITIMIMMLIINADVNIMSHILVTVREDGNDFLSESSNKLMSEETLG